MSSDVVVTCLDKMASTSETGLQLFARLIPRPSLVGLDNVLFPEGPNAKEVIEISGDPSTGKTLLFHQFIAKCILPKEYNKVPIGGLKSGVVLLNTDHHFDMLKLISMLENHLNSVQNFSVSEVEDVVKQSLDRLIIYNVTDSMQLQVTFYALQSLVANQPEIGLILLDSVCAFYWQDTMASGIRKMDLYATTIVKMLQKSLGDFKGVIMYSRPSYFQSKGKFEMSKTGLGFATQKVVLKQTVLDDKYFYLADVKISAGNNFRKAFTISSSGVQWLE